MKSLSRIVWSEGMHLGLTIFRLQNRYFEDSVSLPHQLCGLKPMAWWGAELNEEALRNGSVSVTHTRGILPDGMVFEMP